MHSDANHSLKLISYNIRYDNPADGPDNWQYRREDLASEVLSQHADIIALQEVLSSQKDFLMSKWSGYASYGIGREDGKLKGELIPVFYDTIKFSLISATTHWLSETPDIPGKGWDAACERVVAMVWLLEKKSQQRLLVVNTHWDHIGVEARNESASLIMSFLKPSLDAHEDIVLLGDLNATPEQESVGKLKSVLLDSCPKEKENDCTFNAFLAEPTNPVHIDYILYSSSFAKCKAYEVLKWKTKAGRELSDHYGVVAEIVF